MITAAKAVLMALMVAGAGGVTSLMDRTFKSLIAGMILAGFGLVLAAFWSQDVTFSLWIPLVVVALLMGLAIGLKAGFFQTGDGRRIGASHSLGRGLKSTRCPVCDSELRAGTAQVRGPTAGFLVFGLSWEHLWFAFREGPRAKVLASGNSCYAYGCAHCGLVLIPGPGGDVASKI